MTHFEGLWPFVTRLTHFEEVLKPQEMHLQATKMQLLRFKGDEKGQEWAKIGEKM